jgi:indolepyruvate ferredoxin oxidoreductase beta subunit
MTDILKKDIDLKYSHLSDLQMNIVLAGVGGQGTLIAGKLMGIIAMKLGLDVKVSEVHGMSQRGGSVITYVRIGKKVYSPIIEAGTADFVLCFEELEGLRWASLLKKNGKMLINSSQIKPLPVLMGKAQYPQKILSHISEATSDNALVQEFDALSAAREAGSARAVNMVMLGALFFYSEIPIEIWEEAIAEAFASKAKMIPMNQKAFHAGRDIVKQK